MNILSSKALRPRRLRQHESLRALTRETHLHITDLVCPLFIKEGLTAKKEISSMPGQYQLSLNDLDEEISHIAALGIVSVLLFGIPKDKDAQGQSALNPQGIIPEAIRRIKAKAPHLLVIVDLCFCEYTSHGHCGPVCEHNGTHDVNNDATLPLLGKQAVVMAQAGADVIAPSGMMDGMVSAIRQALDTHGFSHIPILSYAVKYASSFYGPFREAAEGAPKFGDRRTYQMDPANTQEALKEAALDIQEGADMLMVKPAHTYLDIIYKIKTHHPEFPLGAYHVSGEYSMIKAAAQLGWLDEKSAALEALLSIKRAGADFIITYFSKDAAVWLSEK